jgi:rhodanese-related sulfurtransferase
MADRARIEWTRNRVLAVTALALGILAMAGNPVRGHVVRIDTQELATIVGSKVDHVTAPELADWIVRGASDYRLVDIRTPEEFAAYHIPTAENVPITELPDDGLGRNEKIVLYSEGGIHSAQAWMLLRALGYRGVYILRGGLDGWKDEVLFPSLAANPSPVEATRNERLRSISAFFGGTPGAAGTGPAGASGPALPKMQAPSGPSGGSKPVAKKKKEGC